jgi:hypothetical protein
MCSVVLFDFEPDVGFALGAIVVILSTFMCQSRNPMPMPMPVQCARIKPLCL